MKKFRVTVIKTSEYIVDVDETIWNEKERKSWESVFWKLPDTFESDDPNVEAAAGFAESLALESSNQEVNDFIEGFGICARDSYHASLCPDRYTKGLYIKELDTDYETEIKLVLDYGVIGSRTR